MDEFIQTIIKELGCHYMGPDMIGDEEDHKDYIIDQIKKLKEDNPGYETVEKLDKEFSELWDEKEEVKDELLEMEKEKDLWWKEYHDLQEEFKFMICYYNYNESIIHFQELDDIYDSESPVRQWMLELPHTKFWRGLPTDGRRSGATGGFRDDFDKFISDLVKNSEHKEF